MPSIKIATGAARQYTEDQLGGPCNEAESFPTATTAITTLVHGNGDRVGLIFMNLGANPVNVGLTSAAGPNNGILLSANGGVLGMSVRDDFTLPSREWFVLATGGNSQMYVLELVRVSLTTE